MKPISVGTKRAVALAAVLVSAACIISAADDALPLIRMVNVPLADDIRMLARQSNLNYILDPHVPGSDFGPGRLAPKLLVTASWTNVTAQAALSALLKEHSLTMVTNPATTVTRIAPANLSVKPVPTSQVGTNTSGVIPLLVMDSVFLTEAVTQVARSASLAVSLDPELSATAFDTAKVSAAIEVFYRLRGFHPRQWIGGSTFEQVHADFFARLDAAVFGHFSHFKSLHNDDVYKSLSLYLGTTHSAEARRQLREIAETTKNNEQTLICLSWHRDAADIDFLLPYMLADSPASRSLPYHFRNSYGQAASPYLRRALSEAKSQDTRLEAAFEHVHLGVPEGFMYLEDAALKDPEPQGKSARPLERIKQFVADYLASYVGVRKDASLKADIAAQVRTARLLLCEGKR